MLRKLALSMVTIGISIAAISCSNTTPVTAFEENSAPDFNITNSDIIQPLGIAKTMAGYEVITFFDKPANQPCPGWTSPDGKPTTWLIRPWYGDKNWYCGYNRDVTVWTGLANEYSKHHLVALIATRPGQNSVFELCGRMNYDYKRYYSVYLAQNYIALYKKTENDDGKMLVERQCPYNEGECYYLVLSMDGKNLSGSLYTLNNVIVGQPVGYYDNQSPAITAGKPGFRSWANSVDNMNYAIDLQVVPF